MTSTKTIAICSLLFGGILGCGDDGNTEDTGSGFLMLEFDQSPDPDLGFFAVSAQFATIAAQDPASRAAVHGQYGTDGQIADGDCLVIGDIAGGELDFIDVGPTVTATSGSAEVVFDRTDNGSYAARSDFAPFVDQNLARLGSEYTIATSGSDEVEAQEIGSLLLPDPVTGDFVDLIEAGTTFELSATEDFEVNWDPMEGSDRAFVRFHDPTGAAVIACIVPNSGSYTISSEVIAIAPEVGTIAVGHLYERSVEFQGQEFQLIGSSCQFGPHTIE